MKTIARILSSTWLNTLVSFLGISIGIGTLVGISTDHLVKNDAYIVLGIELAIILFLFATRPKSIVEYPSEKGIANKKLFRKSFELLTKRAFDQVRQMNDGQALILGAQVREAQIYFAESYRALDIPLIKAFDICSNPALLLTRHEYHEKNATFITKGGKINRVFIATRANLQNPQYVADLQKVIQLNEDLGVSVKLICQYQLRADEVQDFICYGRSVVIVEGRQADQEYQMSSANMFFKSERIQEYSDIFDEVWTRFEDLSWKETIVSQAKTT